MEASSKGILVLTQHERTSPLNDVTFLQTFVMLEQCSIFEELPCTIAVLPRYANLMPVSIISKDVFDFAVENKIMYETCIV